MGEPSTRSYLGFPPGTHYLVLPRRPRRAALSGLALYDATQPHQRFAAWAGRVIIGAGLGGTMALRRPPPLPAADWWESWVGDVVSRVVDGTIAAAALRPAAGPGPLSGVTALLLDEGGRPLAFAKLPAPGRPSTATLGFLEALTSRRLQSFRVPRLWDTGEFSGRSYMIHEPLPPGPHRRMRFRPATLHAIVSEMQDRLAAVDRPRGTPAGHVGVHGDLLPINLRVASDGNIWVFDWDRAGWGPPLADEAVYWVGDFARRFGSFTDRRARRICRVLRGYASDGAIAATIEWRRGIRPAEGLPAEQDLREAVAALAASRCR